MFGQGPGVRDDGEVAFGVPRIVVDRPVHPFAVLHDRVQLGDAVVDAAVDNGRAVSPGRHRHRGAGQMLLIDLDVARRRVPAAVPVDRDAAPAGRVQVADQVEAVAVDGAGGEGGGGCVREPRAGGTEDRLLRPGPVLAGQDAAQGLLWQARLVPERVQAVAAVGTGLVAADGIAQRGPRGVGTRRCRPVAEDTGEKVRLVDGLRAVEAVGGLLHEGGELFEGVVQMPELAERARTPVVGCVIEAGQPDSAVLDVHHRGLVEDAVPGARAEQEDAGDPLVPRSSQQVRGLPGVHEGAAGRLAGHPVDLAPVTGVGAHDPCAVPAFVADQVAGQHAPVAGMHGMLTWIDGGRPGQRSRAVRPGLHGPPGGVVRLAGGGHPGAGGLLRRTIGGHGVIHSRHRKPTLPRPVRSS